MALETRTVDKENFPVVKKGYDPEAVDRHLQTVTRELERLRAAAQSAPTSVATNAGSQVKAIIEAAEDAAAQLKRDVEQEARKVRQEISEDAQRVRERSEQEIERVRSEAEQQASGHIDRVAEASAGLLESIDQLDAEIAALFENLRAGATQLAKGLQNLKEAPLSLQVAFDGDEKETSLEQVEQASVATSAGSGNLKQDSVLQEVAETQPVDLEGVRLVALEMALDGKPQREAAEYLADRFQLAEPQLGKLLEEVYVGLKQGKES